MLSLLDPSARLVIAHRGNSMHAPEDTLESLRQGVSLGADGIEFDVRLSADGVPVLMHDPTLERTTDGSGLVGAHTLAQLRKLDAGYRFTRDGGVTYPYRGQGVRIPTLAEVLDAFPALPCIIEIKAPEATVPAMRVIDQCAARERVLIGSFSAEAHALLEGQEFHITASKRDVTRLFWRAVLGIPAGTPTYQACSVPPRWKWLRVPVLRFVRLLRRRGIPTHCWTVNDPAVARRLWAGGVNAILSDDPGTMIALRDHLPGAPSAVERR
ncbi:MAG: glycerophosphodiester phosphodiesterase [Gemmatimonadaceae bacterium]|nr:glycerophosphodiester phosphodiesterase [Gemmatimonadaceae bacterium]